MELIRRRWPLIALAVAGALAVCFLCTTFTLGSLGGTPTPTVEPAPAATQGPDTATPVVVRPSATVPDTAVPTRTPRPSNTPRPSATPTLTAPTLAPPTVVPPTQAPAQPPAPTAEPPTQAPAPTQAPQPTAEPTQAGGGAGGYDSNGDGKVTCADFNTHAAAQAAYEAGYGNLDGNDNDGLACETLP